jgi:hypothetical protein
MLIQNFKTDQIKRWLKRRKFTTVMHQRYCMFICVPKNVHMYIPKHIHKPSLLTLIPSLGSENKMERKFLSASELELGLEMVLA